MNVRPIAWAADRLVLLDQTRLPAEEVYREYTDVETVARAIETMVVRGAPAIGVTAAYGIALAGRAAAGSDPGRFREIVSDASARLARTRPTAVNLFWALDRMARVVERLAQHPPEETAAALVAEARQIHDEDVAANRALGRLGAALLPDPCTVLTHCNAGALATAGYGTALGIVRAARDAGKAVRVIADETRPLLQGARLTAWELHRDGIPVTVICDNMAGARLRRGDVDAVIVGADRIAANGDTANKIGTYPLAVLAREHGVPFYVAAPLSTVDASVPDGGGIPIEERGAGEVRRCGAAATAPDGVAVWNPAFDVTPAGLITAIVTEAGVARPPFTEALGELLGSR